MRDIERLVTDSLRSVGHGYRPTDLYGAQAEFHVRRRRRRALRVTGAVALAGAAVVAAVVVAQTRPFADDGRAPAAPRMVIAATIDVGEGPTGLTFGGNALWSANSGDGTISRIDPETLSVVRTYKVGGQPDDVAAAPEATEKGEVWVADPSRRSVLRIDLSGLSTVRWGPSGAGHIDIAIDEGGLWATRPSGLQFIDEDDPGDAEIVVAGEWSDVAVDDGGAVWLLDERTSSVFRYDPVQDQPVEFAVLSQADTDKDLAVGEGYVWVANGDTGTVIRVDPVTGDVSDKLVVGGQYGAVTTGEGAVWVLSAYNSGTGTLLQIDPDTIQIRGRLPLEGGPADVAVANGSLWVTNKDAGTVTRIDLIEP